MLSPDGAGVGGGATEDVDVPPKPAPDFDSASVELMALLTPGGEPAQEDTPPDIPPEDGEESQRGDLDIPDDNDLLDIPVDDSLPQGQELQGMKDDILEEIRKLLPQDEPGADEPGTPALEEEVNSEEFMQKYMENPVEAVTELANRIADKKVSSQMEELKQQLAPVMEQSKQIEANNRAKEALTQFMSNEEFGDASDFINEIAQYINENNLPKDDSNSYEKAYYRAKTNALQNNQGRSLDDYLGDEEAVNQITANDAIKQKIIAQYLQEIAKGQKPVTLGGDSSTPAATPATELNSIDDAGVAMRKMLG